MPFRPRRRVICDYVTDKQARSMISNAYHFIKEIEAAGCPDRSATA